jgi:hypothetical protein
MIKDVYKNPEVAKLLGDPSDDVIITDEGLICSHVELDEDQVAELKKLGITIEDKSKEICG